jgi:hypothetical protein
MASADCWGICLLFYKEMTGYDLPDYFYTEQEIQTAMEYQIAVEAEDPSRWQEIEFGKEQVGDILLFNISSVQVHCGIMVNPVSRDFLHTFPGRNSCIERLDSVVWKNRYQKARRWIVKAEVGHG